MAAGSASAEYPCLTARVIIRSPGSYHPGMTTQGDCPEADCDYKHPMIEGEPDPSYLPIHMKRAHSERYPGADASQEPPLSDR